MHHHEKDMVSLGDVLLIHVHWVICPVNSCPLGDVLSIHVHWVVSYQFMSIR